MEYTPAQYIESKTTLLARIIAIDALIDTMILRLADVAGGLNVSVEEYQMDDGQMKIKTRYRDVKDVEAGVKSLEKMKQMYENRHNGRVFHMRDSRSYR